MSAETVTFQNIDLYETDARQVIYEIGAEDGGTGVIPEIAAAFKYDLTAEPDADNIGGLREKVGPAKELQQNIGRVQETLGTDEDAFGIARDWVTRSGLLLPVARGYLDPDAIMTSHHRMFFISDGVRNWMQRRADTLLRSAISKPDIVILGAGSRTMNPAEGPDVKEGMLASKYMEEVIEPRIAATGLRTELAPSTSEEGDDVMQAMAFRAYELLEKDPQYADVDRDNLPDIVMISNAGAWPQNVGQLRRALILGSQTHHRGSGFDGLADNLFVGAEGIKLGKTGKEPKGKYQNPMTALGMILRGAEEMLRNS